MHVLWQGRRVAPAGGCGLMHQGVCAACTGLGESQLIMQPSHQPPSILHRDERREREGGKKNTNSRGIGLIAS